MITVPEIGVFDAIICLWGLIMLPYIVFLSRDRFLELFNYYPRFIVATILAALTAAVVPVQIGRMAREQISHLPWKQVYESFVQWGNFGWFDGFINGLGALLQILLYLVWTLVIPGHIFAMILQRESDKRPLYPYVISAFVGLLAYIFNKQIYDLLYYVRF